MTQSKYSGEAGAGCNATVSSAEGMRDGHMQETCKRPTTDNRQKTPDRPGHVDYDPQPASPFTGCNQLQ